MARNSTEVLSDWLAAGGASALDVALGEASNIVALVDRDLQIQYINYGEKGFTRESVTGVSVLAITPPDYQETSREAYARVFQTGEPTSYEVMFKDDSGLHIWEVRLGPLKIDGEVVAVTTINHEISEERKRSVERDRFFLLSLDTLTVASPDGRFTRVNPAFGEALGYPAEELMGRPMLSLVHPDDRARTQQAFELVLAGEPVTDFENRYTCSDGGHRVFSWRATVDPITGDAYSVARDVTEQRSTETQLRHAQKMEAIGQLAGGVAHDFNNLLLAILANAELARDEEGAHHVAEYLTEIQGAAERAAALTKQLLSFSRRQPMRPLSIDLNELVKGLMKMVSRLLPENIAFELIPAYRLAFVSADPTQLEQVIVNLCVNARDAMLGGGRLTVETENVLINERYTETHPWAKPGRYVLLSVTDTGVGMTPEVRERAFEPFFTTKAVHQGTGLGLSTVYGIVRQHDGMVHIYSEPGRGTTFKVYLPATARSVSDVGDKLQRTPTRGQETILLAEDEPQVRRAVAQILERGGYRVLLAKDGAEAVQVLRQTHEPVHLAILDVVMPELGGPEAWEQMRALRPGLRVLFASGYSDDRFSTGLPPEAQVLEKPFHVDDLLHRIRQTLDA